MPVVISANDYVTMLKGAVAQIRANHVYLSELDAATGDGDHGSTILKVMNNLDAALDSSAGQPLKDILFDAGMAAASTDGGSSAPLIGSFFMGMADPVEAKSELAASDVVAIILAGIDGVAADSKAQIGDKTMMDPLLTVRDWLKANPAPEDVKALMEKVAAVAWEAAEKTKDYLAKFGRARNLGERVLGHPDAGAFSIAFIFKGMNEAL